ncbi:Nuclear import receptor [Dimargaris xerosporica]|nr:Nuclear import receptor [Dimargaris xerosporica]
MASDGVQDVIATLQALYQNPDASTKQNANAWLQNFQQTVQAWTTADAILNAQEAGLEAQIFAAQTLRHKITYDLSDLNTDARLSLRDSLLNLLYQFRTGTRAIRTQLCLSLAGLALQVTEWTNVIEQMVSLYGSNPETVGCLLEFLTVLPEEINSNDKIVMESDQLYRERSKLLLTDNAQQVLGALTQYMQNAQLDNSVRESILLCFCSWLKSGDIAVQSLNDSPLVDMAFVALTQPDLFETAVDVVCAFIFETRDLAYSMQLVETKIMPQLHKTRNLMVAARDQEDHDLVRGFCRIYTEAAEAYLPLFVEHFEASRGILEGLLDCIAFPDLDIVPMTFRFWDTLTEQLCDPQSGDLARPLFVPLFYNLIDIILTHLHYPSDQSDWTATQQDEFSAFRHDMGDVLKDCVVIVGEDQALSRPYEILSKALPTTPAPSPASAGAASSWQTMEAALFSLRAMGAEVSTQSQVLPKILDLFVRLPEHPKIRYAATLVLGRYTFWTNEHPASVPFQLTFICDGFKDPDVTPASAMALRFLCQDCGQWLTRYLDQLHQVYFSVLGALPDRDAEEISEAIAHVIAAVDQGQALAALQPFCANFLERLAELANRGTALNDAEQQEIAVILERVSTFLSVVGDERGPNEFGQLLLQIWPVVQTVAGVYYSHSAVSESLCRFVRCCVGPFGDTFEPHFSELVQLLGGCFQRSGLSCYLWVAKKVLVRYAARGPLRPALVGMLERLTSGLFEVIKAKNGQCGQIPDVVEDYYCLLIAGLTSDLLEPLLRTTWLGSVVAYSISAFAVNERHALHALFGFYFQLLTLATDFYPPHAQHHQQTQRPRLPNGDTLPSEAVAALVLAFRDHGSTLTTTWMRGLMSEFQPGFLSDAANCQALLAQLLPTESRQWLLGWVGSIADQTYSAASKQRLAQDLEAAYQERQWRMVSRTLRDFAVIYRRRNRLDFAEA